ncbi:Cytochrome P450, E-class, group I [Parasponia andersonii]|uniref:Cytochrome P450, E-class, group I n=1 Tax=Parasponia andersonii TaxID=3476 RepID=A0A2P5AYI0_PARAD|nr:Cytochrome P450, E-class, group I [Parasponia andersonii]
MALENIGYVEILAGAIVLYFLFVVHQWHHWRVRKAITRTWPVIGMLPRLFHNISRLHDFATEILKKSRGTLEFKGPWFADLDFIITCDPSNIQHILNTNFANYPKGEEFREVFDVLGDGILNVDSDLWRLQRKMFQTIQRKVMEELIPFLDLVSETGLGQAVFLPHVLPQSCWKLQRWLQIGGEGKLIKARKIFDEFMFRCISIKQEEPSRNKSENEEDQDNFGMLTIYMEEKENPYAIKFLMDVALNFVGAARDTLTASLTWFFWLVATHPDVETKILEEIKGKLSAKLLDHDGYCGGSFGAEELNTLIYLQAALYETFRLYPPIPFNHRTAAKVDALPSGHHVKEKIRPERWISVQGGFVYVPFHKYPMFNGGPRTCLGKDMTLIQMKIVAITLLRSYCFQVVEGHPISPNLTVTLYMKHRLKPLDLHLRSFSFPASHLDPRRRRRSSGRGLESSRAKSNREGDSTPRHFRPNKLDGRWTSPPPPQPIQALGELLQAEAAVNRRLSPELVPGQKRRSHGLAGHWHAASASLQFPILP